MAIKNIDFDDLPEDDFEEREKTVNVTIKLPETVRDMFAKIAHRERRNMMTLGSIVIEKYIEKYIEDYEKQKDEDEA